jgi:hypothetical protein
MAQAPTSRPEPSVQLEPAVAAERRETPEERRVRIARAAETVMKENAELLERLSK